MTYCVQDMLPGLNQMNGNLFSTYLGELERDKYGCTSTYNELT